MFLCHRKPLHAGAASYVSIRMHFSRGRPNGHSFNQVSPSFGDIQEKLIQESFVHIIWSFRLLSILDIMELPVLRSMYSCIACSHQIMHLPHRIYFSETVQFDGFSTSL